MYRYVHRNRVNGQRGKSIVIPLSVDVGCEDEHGRPLPPGAREDGQGWYELEVPGCWDICHRCEGNGSHTNPSIDGNGLTQEDFEDWDEDMVEGYFNGRYDVRCEMDCQDGKVWVIDYDKIHDELVKWWVDRYFEEESDRADEGRADARTRWYEDGCPMD